MCQIFEGQLIVSFPKVDPAAQRVVNQIREHQIEHVSHIESMEQKLESLNLRPEPDIEFDFHLIGVPVGQENWKANFLQFFYKHALVAELGRKQNEEFWEAFARSNFHFTVSPNYQMSLAGAAGAPGPVSVKNFQFGRYYSQFRSMIGLPAQVAQPSKAQVLVLDSGIAPDANTANINIQSQYNMVDPNQPYMAIDDVGHGTAITLVIADLAPHAEFTFIKVADATGRVSEWDALAGLVAQTDADVVNLSLQFGLPDQKPCNVCGRGRESAASRSAIFENVVSQLQNRPSQPFIVAAAGNSALPELAYPARFGNVLAIGSVTSQKRLSSFSNYGNQDHTGSQHTNHFVLPGGDTDPMHPEDVLTSTGGQSWSGTSLSAAFASGLIAHKLGQLGTGSPQRNSLLSALKQNADKNLSSYSTDTHGNGLMRS